MVILLVALIPSQSTKLNPQQNCFAYRKAQKKTPSILQSHKLKQFARHRRGSNSLEKNIRASTEEPQFVKVTLFGVLYVALSVHLWDSF